jgi:uncharacterized membrane protein YtjA (UPF0391 family)
MRGEGRRLCNPVAAEGAGAPDSGGGGAGGEGGMATGEARGIRRRTREERRGSSNRRAGSGSFAPRNLARAAPPVGTLLARAQAAAKQGVVQSPTTGAPFQCRQRRCVVLYYAVVFLVIALVAALFGFTGIAAGAAGIAKILFYVFLVVALVAFIAGLMRKG